MMKTIAAVTVSLAVLFASPAAAQDLASGTWTGSITQPDGTSFDVGFEVSGEGSDLSIELIPPADSGEDQTFPFDDIVVTAEQLTFTWDMGVQIMCILDSRPGDSWAGTCTDDRGEEGGMVMIPPIED